MEAVHSPACTLQHRIKSSDADQPHYSLPSPWPDISPRRSDAIVPSGKSVALLPTIPSVCVRVAASAAEESFPWEGGLNAQPV